MIPKFFLVLLLPCISLFCNISKARIIEEFSNNLISMDIESAHQSLNEWQETYVEDVSVTEVCRAFLFLLEENPKDARRCFEGNFFYLSEYDVSFTSLITIENLFFCCIDNIEKDVHPIGYRSNIPKIELCKSRFWRLKSIVGMAITAAGCLVAPINPPLGAGLIASGAPMVIQGIEDTLDDHDDIQRKLDERRRMESELDAQKSSFPAIDKNCLTVFA